MPSSPPSFRCVVMGSQSLLIQCGEILLEHGHGIAAVVSADPGILRWADDHELRVIDPHADLVEALRETPFEYFFSITNLSVLPDAVLELPSRAAINFHDGPLPRYAGLNAPAWALMRGETDYGISYHEMTAAVDEGRVLKQRHFEISPGETSLTLNTKCFEAGIDAFAELVPELAADAATPVEQDGDHRSYFGKHDRPEGLGLLDWNRGADELERQVRALDFGRYENPLAAAQLLHGGHVVLVGRAQALERDDDASPGTLQELREDALVVAAGEGAIEIAEFRMADGTELTVAEVATRLDLAPGTTLDGAADACARLDAIASPLARSEAFWVRRLSRLAPLDLPYDHSERAVAEEPRLASRRLDVPSSIVGRASSDPAARADAVVVAAAAYLGRLAGQARFTLGFRDGVVAEARDGIEPFVSDCVPIRLEHPHDLSVGELWERGAAELARVRKRGSWLSDVIARYPALHGKGPSLRRVGVGIATGDDAPSPDAGTALWIDVDASGETLEIRWDARWVDAEDAEAIASQLSHFLDGLAAASDDRSLGRVSLLSADERERILRGWNETVVPFDRDRCVHELFEAQVDRTPDATAVVFEDERLAYRALDERANQLAHHLQGLGVGPDSLVGVCVDRGIEMMVSILAVQKAGGAYLPLDPSYPADRIALMIEDSGAGVLLTQRAQRGELQTGSATVVEVDGDRSAIDQHPVDRPTSGATAENLAYVIYTSGSTGRPKGVMVEHRNVVNFFTGMDACIDHDPPGVWLAVTSLSFDISVLELLYTLTRGFEVVVYADSVKSVADRPRPRVDFGLFMWGADDGQGADKYRLMIESAKFADQHGFSSFWTPERHFHAFGGPYPNPSVTSAALATITENISIRGGSCVLPLHNPIRVVEEWAAVDNLANGRVGLSFASGWQPNDFVIRPESFKDAKANLFRDLEVVHALWKGEAVEFANPLGNTVPVRTQPRPVQAELPTWITTAGNVETFRMAGECGANLLTHLLGQTVEEVAEKIRVYRQARADAGHDPEAGIVTLMLHTLVGDDDASVKELAREPMKSYLSSSMALVKDFAWSFPAFKRPGGVAEPADIDLDSLSPEEMDAILEFAFERYYETSGLFGSVETCLEMVERVRAIGVNEIGCLIDYGVPTERMLASLSRLDELRLRSNEGTTESKPPSDLDQSLPAQVERHGVTHLQCTPSMARMLAMDRDAHPALARIQHMMIGGEAFPPSLARELDGKVGGSITNMYGPTETTIWSSTAPVSGQPEKIDIGRPIANTQLYVLDESLEPVPVGVAGELMIGGDGVVRGYHERAELTAERFIPDPFSEDPNARLYRTGDLARFEPDGRIDFLGRMDHQVKVRGYRVELGEIEARLSQHAGIREAVVIVREDEPGDQRLVAYLVTAAVAPELADLKQHLGQSLPEFMIPSSFHVMDALPLTPNGKVDRKALPAPNAGARPETPYEAPESALEELIAAVWKDVLKLEQVGTRDNFFDLGGHSLLVVQAHRQLRDQVPQRLSLTDLYRFPTVRSLAEHLARDPSDDEASSVSRDRAARRKAALSRRRGRGRGRG